MNEKLAIELREKLGVNVVPADKTMVYHGMTTDPHEFVQIISHDVQLVALAANGRVWVLYGDTWIQQSNKREFSE